MFVSMCMCVFLSIYVYMCVCVYVYRYRIYNKTVNISHRKSIRLHFYYFDIRFLYIFESI